MSLSNLAVEKHTGDRGPGTSASGEAAQLNRHCMCAQKVPTIAENGIPQIGAAAVYVSQRDLDTMRHAVSALHRVMSTPAWSELALAGSADIARRDPGSYGVLFGFDFHLSPSGPRLIEINTNAGGALISTQVLRAQSASCGHATVADPVQRADEAEAAIVASFLAEWQAQRSSERPRTIAIVDDDPLTQYLHPEFLLFVQLFERVGIEAFIADARELEGGADGLRYRGREVDMVYNRLTDFSLEKEWHQTLREAYQAGSIVLTPHPHAHALHADKRHLIHLSDAGTLRDLGVDEATTNIIRAAIPRTQTVRPELAEALWAERRSLFFKPAGAYGGKGVYEGAKLTKTVFQRLVDDAYIAQETIPPPTRQVWVDGQSVELKYDVRCFAYRGEVQLVSARLYRGQTTNFRTPGGGFAAVHVVAD